MDRVLAVARPAFDAASVVDIARRTFDVDAAAARDLGSERDQTFLLLDDDDAPLAVLKLSNATELPPLAPFLPPADTLEDVKGRRDAALAAELRLERDV